jgi:hypothetical protein
MDVLNTLKNTNPTNGENFLKDGITQCIGYALYCHCHLLRLVLFLKTFQFMIFQYKLYFL